MKYLIMHGSYTRVDNPKYWFTWLINQLQAQGNQVISPQFPTEDWSDINQLQLDQAPDFKSKQSLSSWEHVFVEEVIPQIKDEPFIFIGHSIAPVFILHMLQKYSFKLAGAIFVAPFFVIPDRPDIWQFYLANKTFYTYNFDFAKIKSQILGKTYVVYGDNDPYVPPTESPLFADKLGSELVTVKDGRHCGSNYQEFSLVLDLILKVLD